MEDVGDCVDAIVETVFVLKAGANVGAVIDSGLDETVDDIVEDTTIGKFVVAVVLHAMAGGEFAVSGKDIAITGDDLDVAVNVFFVAEEEFTEAGERFVMAEAGEEQGTDLMHSGQAKVSFLNLPRIL